MTGTRTVATTLALAAALVGAAPAALAQAPTTAGTSTAAARGHATTTAAARAASPRWAITATHSSARLRGLAPVSRNVAWASGADGTVLRTVDGGRTWRTVSPRRLGTEKLQFRDVEAFSSSSAVILSIGEGTDSRVLRTDDGGRSWRETFRNTDPKAFYDCMAFSNRSTGLAMSDPIGGRFRLAATSDGGRHWRVLPAAGVPEAKKDEAAFAASGTCLIAAGGNRFYLAGGGTNPARFYASNDAGRSWSVMDTPLPGATSAGVFSIAFRGTDRGVLVGGDFTKPAAHANNAAFSVDGGRSWRRPARGLSGYRSGAAFTGRGGEVLAVGPTGTDISTDGGASWRFLGVGSFDAVACTRDGACWASGEKGRIAVLRR